MLLKQDISAMEEEKDQLLKRVERLKKRVRQSGPAGPFVLLMLGILQDSLWNENMTPPQTH